MNMPVVVLDRDFSDIEVNVVLTDHRQGGYEATRHLLALGHQRIGCIAGPSNVNPSVQRVMGYRQALEDAGVSIDEALVLSGDFQPQSGWANARILLAKENPPTAIFSCNDMMALGVLRAADELGKEIPKDLAVVGYDDIQLASYSNPPLTTVKQPKSEMGQAAIDCLINAINNQQASTCRTTLPVSLVVRGSCGGE